MYIVADLQMYYYYYVSFMKKFGAKVIFFKIYYHTFINMYFDRHVLNFFMSRAWDLHEHIYLRIICNFVHEHEFVYNKDITLKMFLKFFFKDKIKRIYRVNISYNNIGFTIQN